MGITTSTNLIHANFFFVDIVGLSDPFLSTSSQIKKITALNDSIKECEAFKNTPKETMITLPTGDGMCLGFMQGPHLPLLLASQLHYILSKYNQGKIPSETVRVRIGLHSGNCFTVNDILGNKNVWGPGIILCRRVMDLGEGGHILLTPRLAEDLIELSDDYKQCIRPIHDFTIKHGQTLLIYSAHGDDFGNSNPPTKGGVQNSKIGEEYNKIQKTTLYTNMKVSLTLKDPKTMLMHHKRYYEIANISNKPIYHVLHGIATDVDKYSFNDLNVKVYDENGKNLKISSINIDRPDCKEFTTEFNQPIIKEEKNRSYTLEYDVEEPERYFENAFLIDSKNLELSIELPKNEIVKEATLYQITQETELKTKSDIQPIIESKDSSTIMTWKISKSVKGQTFRIEW